MGPITVRWCNMLLKQSLGTVTLANIRTLGPNPTCALALPPVQGLPPRLFIPLLRLKRRAQIKLLCPILMLTHLEEHRAV